MSCKHIVQLPKPWNGPVTLRFAHQHVDTTLELQPSIASPVCSPTVSDCPVFNSGSCLPPAGDLHGVINVICCIRLVGNKHPIIFWSDLAVVHHERGICCKRAGNGPSGINFFHHCHLARQVAIRTHTIPCPRVDWPAAMLRQAVATLVSRSTLHVSGLIRHTGFIWDIVLKQIFVNHPGVSSIASWRGSTRIVWSWHTIHQDLPGKHDIRELRFPHDLNPVVQSSCCPVYPAGSTVLRDVLVHIAGHKVASANAPPIKRFRQVVFGDQGVCRDQADGSSSRKPRTRAPVAMITKHTTRPNEADEAKHQNSHVAQPGGPTQSCKSTLKPLRAKWSSSLECPHYVDVDGSDPDCDYPMSNTVILSALPNESPRLFVGLVCSWGPPLVRSASDSCSRCVRSSKKNTAVRAVQEHLQWSNGLILQI